MISIRWCETWQCGTGMELLKHSVGAVLRIEIWFWAGIEVHYNPLRHHAHHVSKVPVYQFKSMPLQLGMGQYVLYSPYPCCMKLISSHLCSASIHGEKGALDVYSRSVLCSTFLLERVLVCPHFDHCSSGSNRLSWVTVVGLILVLYARHRRQRWYSHSKW